MKYLIINADDFGYSKGINRGIIEALRDGIVTSTSVMVDGVAAQEASLLNGNKGISVGLHFVLPDENIEHELEFQRQLEKFGTLMGRQPDHIDVHKPRPNNYPPAIPILEKYSNEHKVPVRNMGFANFIRSFFGLNTDDNSLHEEKVSKSGLKIALADVNQGFNELMCHVGYSDDYLRKHSSYNDFREIELATLKSKEAKHLIKDMDITLCTWHNIKVI